MAYTGEIINGIATAVHKATGYPVYINFKKQKATFPCFYINHDDSEQEQKLDNRYYREGTYTVSFFMSELGEIQDVRKLHEIAEILYWALEYISVEGGKLRGTEMSDKISDDVLKFKVHYDFFIKKVQNRTPMEHLDVSEGVSNGNDKETNNESESTDGTKATARSV